MASKLETELLSEEQNSILLQTKKCPIGPCRQNRESCSAVPQVSPVLQIPDTPPSLLKPKNSFGLPLPIPGKTAYYCLKYIKCKNPNYSQHTKTNTLHQLKGLKANQEKQVTRKEAYSCHKVQLIRPNPAMEIAEEKARPWSDLWTQI